MPYFTTGLIENNSVVNDKQSLRLLVEISNEDTSNAAIQIEGFLQSGNQSVKYVDEFFILTSGTVAKKNYYCLFEAFEFQFFVSSPDVNISISGKDDNGNLMLTYHLRPKENFHNMV